MQIQTTQRPWILALFPLAFLVIGFAAYAACGNTMNLANCVNTTTSSEDPGFDVTNSCGWDMALNVTATGLDFTVKLRHGETMSSQILSEISSSELETLTEAYKDGSLSIKCCPDYSSDTHCMDPDLA